MCFKTAYGSNCFHIYMLKSKELGKQKVEILGGIISNYLVS